jgi:hypothetical protein
MPTSAVNLMRLQLEALTHSMWLIYAARDHPYGFLGGEANAQAQLSVSGTRTVQGVSGKIHGGLDGRAPERHH